MNDTQLNDENPITQQNIAVFGGAFNPPTFGHLSIIKKLSHFDQILIVPNFGHAWGKTMASYDTRCRWLEIFLSECKLSQVMLCKEEENIAKDDQVTTWALLNHLQTIYPSANLTFVIGPDNLLNFNKFYRATDILTRWSLYCAPEEFNIRSTMVRDALKKGESITHFTTSSLASSLHQDDFISE